MGSSPTSPGHVQSSQDRTTRYPWGRLDSSKVVGQVPTWPKPIKYCPITALWNDLNLLCDKNRILILPWWLVLTQRSSVRIFQHRPGVKPSLPILLGEFRWKHNCPKEFSSSTFYWLPAALVPSFNAWYHLYRMGFSPNNQLWSAQSEKWLKILHLGIPVHFLCFTAKVLQTNRDQFW